MFDVGAMNIRIIVDHRIDPVQSDTEVTVLTDKDNAVDLPVSMVIGILEMAKVRVMHEE